MSALRPINYLERRGADPLSTPITGHWNHLVETAEDFRDRVRRERCGKLLLLAELYGIADLPDDSMLLLLAMRLAIDHVPGFQILAVPPAPPKKRGRPKGEDDFRIFLEIEVMREETKSRGEAFDVSAACRKLHAAHSTRRGGSELNRKTSKSIETAYYAARKKYGSVDRERMKWMLGAARELDQLFPRKKK